MVSEISNSGDHNLVDLFQTSFLAKSTDNRVEKENVQVFLFVATKTFGLREINLEDEVNVGKLSKWLGEDRLIVVTRQIESGDFFAHASSKIADQLKKADNLRIEGKNVVLKEVSEKDYASLNEIQEILIKNLNQANKEHKKKKSENKKKDVLFHHGNLLQVLRKFREKQILPAIKLEISKLLSDIAQNLIEHVRKEQQTQKKFAEEQNRKDIERTDIKKSEILKEEIKKLGLQKENKDQEQRAQIRVGKSL